MVTIGRLETPYRRSGAGRPILLLAAVPGLFEELATGFRVIEPLRVPVRPGDAAWAAWLQGVIDGLGLDRPALVVDASCADAARRLAAVDPLRVGPVLDAGAPNRLRGGLADYEIIDR